MSATRTYSPLAGAAAAQPVAAPPDHVAWSRVRRLARSYVARRAAKALFTIWLTVTFTFFLVRLMPGNPVQLYIGQLMAQYNLPYVQARDQAAALFAIDLNEPVWHQYLGYVQKLLHGNMGTSFLSRGMPVGAIIRGFLPWTLFTVGTGVLISFTLGIGLGMLMAYRRESVLDHGLSILGSLLHSIPSYLLAIVILVFLGVQWQIVPATRMRGSLSSGVTPSFSLPFFLDVLFHAALPITTYVLTTVGTWMLTMKASTVSTLEEDYVAMAKAKGLADGRIATAYVGRNAVLPLFTQLTLSMGFVFGGAVVIETIFVYRGIAQVLVSAVNGRDYPVMQGVFLVTTTAVVAANLLADLLYSRIDPRIRLGGSQ